MSKQNTKGNHFVEKVYDMLESAEREGFDEIVRWEEDGKSFKVQKSEEFEKKIQPKYFNQTKLRSFQRKLISFGFTSIQGGPARGAYRHEKFVRGERDLCREVGKKEAARAPSSTTGDGELKDSASQQVTWETFGLVTTPAIEHTLTRGDATPITVFNEESTSAELPWIPSGEDAKARMGGRSGTDDSPPSRTGRLQQSSHSSNLAFPFDGFTSETSSSSVLLVSQSGPVSFPAQTVSKSSMTGELSCYTLLQEAEEEADAPRVLESTSRWTTESAMSLFSMDLDELLLEDDDVKGEEEDINKKISSRQQKHQHQHRILETSCSSGPMMVSSMTSLMKQPILMNDNSSGIGTSSMFLSSSNSWVERLSEDDGNSSGFSSSASSSKRHMAAA